MMQKNLPSVEIVTLINGQRVNDGKLRDEKFWLEVRRCLLSYVLQSAIQILFSNEGADASIEVGGCIIHTVD
jgi:hypothetical protein